MTDQPAVTDEVAFAEIRCRNCEHKVDTHHADGCWYALDSAPVDANLVCQCNLPPNAAAVRQGVAEPGGTR